MPRLAGKQQGETLQMIMEEKTYSKPIKITSPKKKKGSPLILAENSVPLGKKDYAKNFDKYFEESLK